MRARNTRSFVVGTAVVLFAVVCAARVNDPLSIRADFQHWYLVNSMVVTKDSPLNASIGGLHHIFVNSAGLSRVKAGGDAPYPDGTVFTDDVREFALVDGPYVQGKRKAIPVMVKDAKKYSSTGGWGFQAWAEGDPKKPLVTDPVTACFQCHQSRKANDFVFSTYLN